jgi:hypothetical protein
MARMPIAFLAALLATLLVAAPASAFDGHHDGDHHPWTQWNPPEDDSPADGTDTTDVPADPPPADDTTPRLRLAPRRHAQPARHGRGPR